MKKITHKACSVCGKQLSCGSNSVTERCWCASFPAIMPLEYDKDCQCPECLAQTMSKRIEAMIQTHTLEQSLELAARFRDNQKLIENIDYTKEDGNMVFSAWYHLKRGECCGNGCRNCPYGDR